MSKAIRLFCFPYAGAGAVVFRGWSRLLGEGVDVRAVELPGHGARRGEPLLAQIQPLVERLADELGAEMESPYASFGHSLGAVLGFEVARRVRELGGPEPSHLFLSAHRAPHVAQGSPPIYHLPDISLTVELERLGGAAARLLRDPDLIRLFMPALRADLRMSDLYRAVPEPPLGCPITAFAASGDSRAPEREVRGWAGYTTGAYECLSMPGSHFYLEDKGCGLWEEIRRRLDGRAVQAASRAR